MTDQDGRVTLNILQAAEAAGVSRRTIYNWMADKKIVFLRTAGGSVRIYEDSLFTAVAKRETAR